MGDDDPDVAEQLREALRFLAHAAREGHSSTLALLELHGVEPMAAGELAQRIERNARRSLVRIDDFVVFARARLQPLKPEELDLLDLLFDAIAEAWHDGNERGVRLKVVDAPDEALLHTAAFCAQPWPGCSSTHWNARAVAPNWRARCVMLRWYGVSRSTRCRAAAPQLRPVRRHPLPSSQSMAGRWWNWWRGEWAAPSANGTNPGTACGCA